MSTASVQARTAKSPATAAAKVTPAPKGLVQRQCACGGKAGIHGECEECRKKRLGLQPPWAAKPRHETSSSVQSKSIIGANNHPLELEADRIAAQAMGVPKVRIGTSPTVQGRGVRRHQRHDAGHGGPVPPSVARTLRTSGEPLPPDVLGFFEPRLGHDFSHVRIHRDRLAAASAREIAAHAYTAGRHVVFASGRFEPQSTKGQRLIAHELAHVMQQRSSPAHVVWRAPAEADEDEGQESVGMEVTTDPEQSIAYFSIIDEGGGFTLGTVYPGDVLVIRRFDSEDEILHDETNWTIPADVEIIDELSDGGIQLRVPSDVQTPQTLSIGFTDSKGVVRRGVLTIDPLPVEPQAVDPDFARLRQERGSLRAERRAARHSARDERRALRRRQRQERQTFRAKRREERRELRQPGGRGLLVDRSTARRFARDERRNLRIRQRQERRTLRTERREERRELRRRGSTLRRELRGLRRKQSCDQDTQKQVQSALKQAISVADRGTARLRTANALGDPEVVRALGRYMRWTPTDPSAPGTTRHLARIVDTLVVARNGMTLATAGKFHCTTGCKEATGVRTSRGRRGEVDICPTWVSGEDLQFPVTQSLDEARSYALLHEFIHQAGPFAAEEGRFYVGRPDWQTLSAKDALEYADGYAALAWTLAERAGGS